jgi:hypothetical protein
MREDAPNNALASIIDQNILIYQGKAEAESLVSSFINLNLSFSTTLMLRFSLSSWFTVPMDV